MIINSFILILLILLPLYLGVRLYILKFNILVNIKYWLILFGYFYVLLPSYFIEITNTVQSWGFSAENMFNAKLGSVYFIFIILVYSIFFVKDIKVEVTNNIVISEKLNKIINYIWCVLLVYSILVTIRIIIYFISIKQYGLDRVALGNILDEFVSYYRLKSMLFFCFTIGSIKFWRDNKVIYFLPLIFLSLNDVMAGGRTLAFFSIIGIYLNFAIKNKNLYFFHIFSILLVLLVSVTASRMQWQSISDSMNIVENYIYQSLGEFIQPYNTFVYTIENRFLSQNPAIEFVANTFQGILPGFLKENLGLTKFAPGILLANKLDRGYGLGFNILTEAFYYGGWKTFFIYPIIFSILVTKISELLIKLKFPGYILLLYYIIYSRLFFREGSLAYILVPIYIFIIYGSITVFISNVRVFTNIKMDGELFYGKFKNNIKKKS